MAGFLLLKCCTTLKFHDTMCATASRRGAAHRTSKACSKAGCTLVAANAKPPMALRRAACLTLTV